MGLDRLFASLRRAGKDWRPSRRDALMASLGSAVPLVPVMAQESGVSGGGREAVDGPQGGALVARRNAPARTLQAKALDVYSVNDKGAKGDGKTDDTAAINAAILEVHTAGGGEIIFGSSSNPYYVRGPIIVPSNVAINLNGQTLMGDNFNSGTMFTTGIVRGGRLLPNKGASQEADYVLYAAVRNGMIRKCAIAFDLHNFNVSCTIDDIATFEVLQFGIFHRCFYMSMNNCSARGPSDPARPSFHFTGDNNLISLRRVSATTESGFLFEGGTTSLGMIGCSSEGGAGSAVAFRGDCLGVVIDSGYWEAITGTVFDFTRATVCSVSFRSNFMNYCDTVFDDGGETSNSTLFGSFDETNYLASVGGVVGASRSRGRFLLTCPRNFIRFDIPYANAAPATLGTNWTTGAAVRVVQETGTVGFTLADVRSRSRIHHHGPIPVVREGDIGDPLPGHVDRCRINIPRGAAVEATIETAIAWRPSSLRATFILSLSEDRGVSKLFGDIYGDQSVRHDRSGREMVLENADGYVRIRLSGVINQSGRATITGSVQLCT
ncbi:glycosyl hydrolase family 28-related protein [Sphingomonas sp.]|jgi:hypothetical protein|uniref:glycosyl hydrolase family 28-related protein n=1 Tax=Sphingomonas sp. TaxID=28214 RepID=UPI002604420A|nr:glycosyl hydrolase family 28-related protein [Sphingomonas sp.]MDF2496159.1 phiPLPE 63 [Sphingomonas sp.]